MENWNSTLENMGVIDRSFWSGKRIFLTGHTGFKGSWLALWLHSLGAKVMGYALHPPTAPSMFELCRLDRQIESVIGDVRDYGLLLQSMERHDPDIVFHLAAQPLVRASYQDPVGTYATNVMGTVHVLEAARHCGHVRSIVNVTTDKCYENKEWEWGYREIDVLGGYDPYSNSKACAELVTSAFRTSFFPKERYASHQVALGSARAGNVIGGGDWAEDRLLPDLFRAIRRQETAKIRNPRAIRPWQHVLEPLSGYLMLAQELYRSGTSFAEAWNFGPRAEDAKPVEWLAETICKLWGSGARFEVQGDSILHEAHHLKLDCSKAEMKLGWKPRWRLDTALKHTVDWMRMYDQGGDIEQETLRQIEIYGKLGEL